MTVADIVAKGEAVYPAGAALCYRGVNGEFTQPEYYLIAWPGVKQAVVLIAEETDLAGNNVHPLTRWEDPVQMRESSTVYPEEWARLLGTDQNLADWEIVVFTPTFTPY